MKDTTYLTLAGIIWGVYCIVVKETQFYNDTALHLFSYI